MQHNRKNILFKVFAKYIRFLKELRSSYDSNIHGEHVLYLSLKSNLDLVISIADAQNFIDGRDVDIRGLYPLRYSLGGIRKQKMECAFFDFLREKGVYEKYIEYRNDQYARNITLHSYVMRWVDVCDFYWVKTDEGPEFWNNVSNEWKDFCLTTPILDDDDKIKE